MPFLDVTSPAPERAYFRHWAAEEPTAAMVFLHGFGEHTGLYHRYAFALNARGIDVWAVDQLGHGMSPGPRGDFGTIEASSALAEEVTRRVEEARPGLPLVAAGHSFGSIVTLFRVLGSPDRYRAAVISGAPLVAVPAFLDADTSLDLDPAWLSRDDFYLDALANDPLAFVEADGKSLTRELDRAWDRFGHDLPGLAIPTLAVHGEDDPIADPGAVRAYAEQIDPLTLLEIHGGRHDILNDVTHREVAAAVADFVVAQTASD
ncbi:alpha/beta fold hydrolase [Mycolicibacterium sediminis]|uniref:Lysophospholipase n=1 Tax=Mycolicibacterium sediminis TaxID=1286180 RepID=A0A7I7QIK5_9MYCO|nr:alpha/beta fold hydrolase [Mycolicibacterium sediminis]BBY26153.1 lysophospholipase [Mycolicibacterium sediminis]